MTPLYRPPQSRTKLSAQGDRAKRRAPFYAASKKAVLSRIAVSGYACEACFQRGLELDTHHVWGRAGTGAGLGWPWCDMAECLAAICRPCHDAITRGEESTSDMELRRASVQRFTKRGLAENWLTGRLVDDGKTPDLVGLMRALVRDAERNGGADIVLGTRS